MAFVAASESENALRAVDTDADTKRDRDVAKYLERLGDGEPQAEPGPAKHCAARRRRCASPPGR